MYKKIFWSCRSLLIYLTLCLVIPSFVVAKDAASPAAVSEIQWPFQASDLKPDPSIVRGVLANGFRYIIKQNHEPENRVAAYLAVLSGSMEENDAEQGVAHFLEHLMFSGSTNFPPGTLVDYLQSIGMDFGGDTNAYTGFEKTVYHLILPNGKESELDVGCKVLADYARGALLLDSEIDRERGVIFSEKRSRDSAAYRNYVAYSEFAFKGTRYPLRLPIGKESVLQTAEHNLLKGYYDKWYRPDNIVLVLVGDLDIEAAKRSIASHFSTLKSGVLSPKRPAFGTLKNTGVDVFYSYEPELGKTNVSIETLWDIAPKTPSKIDEKDELVQMIGNLIIGYRLQQDQEAAVQPYVMARYSAGIVAKRIGYGSIYGVTTPKSWDKTLKRLFELIESVRLYGFTTREVTRAKNEIQAELEKNVQTETSLHSRLIAERIVDHLVDGEVYMSPVQEWELYNPMLNSITIGEVNTGFNKIWDNASRLISITGDTELDENGKTDIKRFYNSITQANISKRSVEKDIVFPYLDKVSDIGGVKVKKIYPELGVTRYTLENGLILNLKRTDFEKNTIRISANFGNGALDEERAGMAFIADDVINLSGTKTLSPSDLDSVIAGSSVNLSFRIGRESSSWSGSTLSEEVDLFVQVLQAMVVDASFEEVAYNKVMGRLELMYKRLDREIDGAVLREVQPFFAGNNAHYGIPSWRQLSELKFSDIQVWVKNHLDIEDLEISVVGDFDESNIVNILNEYFGGLKLKGSSLRILNENIAFPEGRSLVLKVPSEIEKSTVFLTWPTSDFWDIGRTRRLSVLAAVIEDRLRKTVREKLGASYSPRVSSYGSRIHKNYGYIQVEVNVESGKEESLAQEIENLISELVRTGITDEELIRAKKPVLTSVLENVKTNQYWLFSVLALSSRHSDQLNWPTTIVDDINSITVAELNRLSDKYLRDKKVAVAIVKAGQNEPAEKR